MSDCFGIVASDEMAVGSAIQAAIPSALMRVRVWARSGAMGSGAIACRAPYPWHAMQPLLTNSSSPEDRFTGSGAGVLGTGTRAAAKAWTSAWRSAAERSNRGMLSPSRGLRSWGSAR